MGQFYSNHNKGLLKAIHKNNCLLGEINDFDDHNVINEYVLEKQDRGDFQIDRGIDQKGCSTLVCKICGNDKFIVGQKSYYTAIKCEHCGYEVAVHIG